MAQTSYALSLTEGYAGTLADSRDAQIEGHLNSTGAEVPYGVMVAASTTNGSFRAVAATRMFLGVLINSNEHEQATTGLLDKAMGNILVKGRVRVAVEEAVAIGGAVRVRLTAGGDETVGAFRTTADSTDCAVVPNARWVTAGTGTQILELNLPGNQADMVITADT